MGGKPLTALNLACFSANIDSAILAEILKGGAEKNKRSRSNNSWGHTISDDEIKYGLSITGIVDPKM